MISHLGEGTLSMIFRVKSAIESITMGMNDWCQQGKVCYIICYIIKTVRPLYKSTMIIIILSLQ